MKLPMATACTWLAAAGWAAISDCSTASSIIATASSVMADASSMLSASDAFIAMFMPSSREARREDVSTSVPPSPPVSSDASATEASMAAGAGMVSITSVSTLEKPARTSSTSSRSIPSGTVAVAAKGNASSTVTLVNSGDPSDQPSQIVTASSGTDTMPSGFLYLNTHRCHPRHQLKARNAAISTMTTAPMAHR